jgi:5-methyltetrahydrofolate--homocysteine methyltransferase
METKLETIFQDVAEGELNAVEADVQAALDSGLAPQQVLSEGMIAAMREVGARFERQEYYVPEMLLSAVTMKRGLALLRPRLVQGGVQPLARVAIGSVQGDLHDIGKNLVGMMLEGAGFEVIDLGADVPPKVFVQAVQDGANLIGISALLTTTMRNIPDVVKALSEAGLRDRAKIIVGGAPVTQSFADQIGADGFSPDASRAVALAKSLLALA